MLNMHSCIAIYCYCTFSLLLCFHTCNSIVNPQQQTANTVIYMRRPMGPSTWQAGVECIDNFTSIYFQRMENLTRSYNMVITSSINMTTPAAQIQEGYLKLMNEAVSQRSTGKQRLYQLRVISDAHPYVRDSVPSKALVYADYYIIIVDSVMRLQNLMYNYIRKMVSWNPGARFLILYNDVEERNAEEEIALEIFSEMLDNFYVHYIGLLYATSDVEYSFSVLDYYTNTPCRSLRRLHLGTCHRDTAVQDAYKLKILLRSFYKNIRYDECTFFMCASIAAPFVEEDCHTGIEMRIVSFIRNRLGFKLNRTCVSDTRGVLDEETEEWTGLLSQLNERYCDFILGGYYPDNEVLSSFWTSDCYLSNSFTWFAKLADPRPAWKGLYSIFKNQTWLCCIVLLLVTWLFWYFIVNMLPEPVAHRELSLAGINAMAVSICAAVNERPDCNASRIFFLAIALYGLNLAAIYTSKLIAVFTNPGFLHQIDDIDKVVAAGIPFGGAEENRDWFENDEDMWIFNSYNYSHDFESTSENLLAVKLGQRVILSNRMYILQHNISDYIYAFPQNVFSSPLQMIVKPGFPFLYNFNKLIRSMRDFGIFQKIARDFHFNNTYLNRISKMRPAFHESVIVLTTEHLQGPFAILIVGCAISTFCFVTELAIYWLRAPYVNRRFGWNWFPHTHRAKENSSHNIIKKEVKKNLRKKQRQKRNAKKSQKANVFQKNDNATDVAVYNVSAMEPVRFTPLKRRKIIIK